jgi:uncharacterized membrane protein HdeD (DUF308 family)
MANMLARNWWAVALRGVIAILFGLAALFLPGITVTVLVLLFGAYALVDGIFTLIAGIRRAAEHRSRWLTLIMEGLLGIIAGIIALVWPGVAQFGLLWVIAAWAILTGILEIAAAIRLRREIQGEAWLVLSGLASLVFGVLLLVWPVAGILALIWLIGAYGIVFGVLLLVLAFRLRSWQNTYSGQAGAL